ncbi:uncharacterized protein MONOS_4217 [Monocercomonoides exilis]|uniref:uncharacterized protein n=1 Tax=Monocercomonoides exilis TaxID=2049356 RepID=UPI003559E68B|nr:hypothetical protein MONOS_4217 [Monocercomonoides exilis]|eukprot:MONOS_4217.1-p1 / transcript=MONOS_4217.1 / gene=MONOS_4217 / organism=Monocercomonoides_exilis_PA203 / gene_product=unspecified product / transcript_product=unspecified product / location=Mono_scaffold00109:69477-70561(+) / protein_length=289 / sequence_SO=supercontig / SO=protein_coding / is_pseudo=false
MKNECSNNNQLRSEETHSYALQKPHSVYVLEKELEDLKEKAQLAQFTAESREVAMKREIQNLKNNIDNLKNFVQKKDETISKINEQLSESKAEVEHLKILLKEKDNFHDQCENKLRLLMEQVKGCDIISSRCEEKLKTTEEKADKVMKICEEKENALKELESTVEKQAAEIILRKKENEKLLKSNDELNFSLAQANHLISITKSTLNGRIDNLRSAAAWEKRVVAEKEKNWEKARNIWIKGCENVFISEAVGMECEDLRGTILREHEFVQRNEKIFESTKSISNIDGI